MAFPMFNNPYQGGGFMDRNRLALGTIGANLLSGQWTNAGNNLPQAMALDRAGSEKRKRENATLAWLKSQNVIPPEYVGALEADPSLVGPIFQEIMKQKVAGGNRPNPYTDIGKANSDLQAGWMTPEQHAEAIKPQPGRDPATVGNITTLRKELSGQPGTSRYRTAVPILHSMMGAVDTNTAMSDLDFIYGMAKIFDPESVVREGEMVLVKNAQSLPDQVVGLINKLNAGEATLSSQARRDLVNASLRRVGEYRKQAEGESTDYGNISTQLNINPELVVRPLDAMPAWPVGVPSPQPASPAPKPATLIPGTIEDGYRFKGGDPADPNNWEKVL